MVRRAASLTGAGVLLLTWTGLLVIDGGDLAVRHLPWMSALLLVLLLVALLSPARPAAANGEVAGARAPSRDDLQEDRRILEAAVGLARRLATAVDSAEVRKLLESTLYEQWPDASWVVMSAAKVDQASIPPEARLPASALQYAILQSADTPLPLESSGTIVSRHLEEAANRAVFTLRDANAVYAVVVADRSEVDEQTAARAEIFLRVGVAALRTTSLLESLVTSEKLAAVGRLAAGVAHEINNPLAFVLMNLRAMEAELGEPHAQTAKDAREGAERIQQIVEGMRVLSHSEELHVEQVDLVQLAMRTAKIARARNLRVPVQVEASGPVWTMGDEVRMGQILLNLMTNAVDAAFMSEEPRVTVHVSSDAGLAIVEVEDNGKGVARDVRARLFEPGISTKGRRGSGLGLRISRSLARAHEGELDLARTSTEGSVFRLTMPHARNPRSMRPPAPEPEPAPTGQPSVLVIDDEIGILRAVERWLGRSAQITGTTDPVQGLNLARSDEFDLILCDLNMPGMSGDEVLEALRGSAPRAAERMVIMTGAIDEQVKGAEVITKPLDPAVMLELLAHCGARRESESSVPTVA